MQLLQYTLLTLVVAFFIQYWVLSVITSKKPQNTVGKFYLSMISASIMGILEVLIYDTYKSVVSLFYYLVLLLMLYLFVYLFKSQTGIDDVDYLKQMMESHSREMELSKIAAEKTTNNQIKTIANSLIQRRQRDIDVIEKMLDDNSKKAPITKKNLFTYLTVRPDDTLRSANRSFNAKQETPFKTSII